MARRLRQHLPKNWHFAPGAVSAAIATSTGGCGFQGDNSSGEPQFHLLGGQAWGAYLRRKERVNSSRQQNPFIFRQILERYLFLLGSRVGLWENCIERSQSEWHGRDLGVLRRCRHQSQFSSPAMTLRTNSIENSAAGLPHCSPPWTSPPARCSPRANLATAAKSSSPSYGIWTSRCRRNSTFT